jgi:large conductance mechanosensitive channel
MPAIGKLTGNVDFTSLVCKIGEGEGAAVLKYGQFIQNIVDFLIVALCIFCIVKAINAASKKKEEPAPEPPAGPTQEELLAEIRDLLAKK